MNRRSRFDSSLYHRDPMRPWLRELIYLGLGCGQTTLKWFQMLFKLQVSRHTNQFRMVETSWNVAKEYLDNHVLFWNGPPWTRSVLYADIKLTMISVCLGLQASHATLLLNPLLQPLHSNWLLWYKARTLLPQLILPALDLVWAVPGCFGFGGGWSGVERSYPCFRVLWGAAQCLCSF